MNLYKNGFEFMYLGPGPYMLDRFTFSLGKCSHDKRYQLRVGWHKRALCFIVPLRGYKTYFDNPAIGEL